MWLNLSDIVDHECNDNGTNLLSIEEEADVTSIQYINAINDISTSDDENFIYKYYAPFLSSNIHEDLSSRSEYD